MTQSLNELMNDKGVCRTAPATLGLLKRDRKDTDSASERHSFHDLYLELILIQRDFCADQNLHIGDFM